MECFKRGGEKRLAEIRNSRHSLICSNRKSRPSLLHRPAFRELSARQHPLLYWRTESSHSVWVTTSDYVARTISEIYYLDS